jgi:hypothetical protein
MSAEAEQPVCQATQAGGRINKMNSVQYLKAYAALAVYIVLTSALGVNFWQVGADGQPLWVVGALAVARMVPVIVCQGRVAAR